MLTLAVAAAGIGVRLCHWAAFTGVGFDESLYRHYLGQLIHVGLGRYPDIVDSYLDFQKTIPGSILPPTRFLYILCAYGWHGLFGTGPLACFYAVSRVFSVGTFLIAGGFARRLFADRRLALAVFALMAFSPLQIHMAQHALVDGFFEFWALLTLWALWENLRQPRSRGWLTIYTGGLALMVTTKENAFFVFVAILAILAVNRWLRFGTVSRALLVLTFVGPVIGVAILTNAAGGLGTLLNVYLLGVPKNLHLEYAIATGDGPWYRYLLDLLTISPLVCLLGLRDGFPTAGAARTTGNSGLALVFMACRVIVLMANVKYGMNLALCRPCGIFRCATLAMGQVMALANGALRWSTLAIAALDWRCWSRDCARSTSINTTDWRWRFPLYELVPADLLHALKMLK